MPPRFSEQVVLQVDQTLSVPMWQQVGKLPPNPAFNANAFGRVKHLLWDMGVIGKAS